MWNAASCPMRQRRENCVTRPTLLVIKAIMAKKHQGIFQEMAEANKALAK